MQARIRDAAAMDAAAIRDIYNNEVARTCAAWIAAQQEAGRPVLMPEAGVKFGRWLDLVLLQLVLDPGKAPR